MLFVEALQRLQKVVVRGNTATALCPAHVDSSRSLGVIRLNDGEAFFTCFAGCDWHRITEALGDQPVRNAKPTEAEVASMHERTARAVQIWESGLPTIASPVQLYLQNRGIELPRTSDLRYLPEAKHPDGNIYPAMVAAVTDASGRMTAIHRTFLTPDGKKASCSPSKMMMGACAGSAVRFRDGRVTQSTVFIAEGIETALSIRQLFGNITVYAGLSVYGMGKVGLLGCVRRVVIVADGDEPGSVAYHAAYRAAARYIERGYDAHLMRCQEVGKDFNDILQERLS